MQQTLPGLIIIPTYVPFAYTREVVQPFLVDGALWANERRALREDQAALYDESGTLRAEAQPRGEKIDDGYGRVWAEIP